MVRSKYNAEYKLKVVQEYLVGQESYEILSKKYHALRFPSEMGKDIY